jgi:hypothetical protein
MNDIFAAIKSNPEGGTVGREGRETPEYGFFVGGHGDPITFSAGTGFTPDLKRQVSDWIGRSNAPYIGWWTDEETGALYLDGSDWIESQSTAEQIGRLRKEIAIWDIGNERELRFQYVEGE